MSSTSVGRVRWIVAALLFGETILNYLDYNTLSVLAPHLSDELGMTNIEYARISMAFQVAYLISFACGGWVIDKLGVRWGLGLSILWWSLAEGVCGLVNSTRGLMAARGLLGLGYPGAYLAAAKAASEWYPPQERGLVTGIYTSGALIGATVAPPLIVWLTLTYTWRYAFFITGGAGVLYVLVWFLIYRPPSQHPFLSETERNYILAGRSQEAEPTLPIRQALPFFFRNRYFWAVIVGRLIGDTPWIFYVLWIPKFLSDSQGMDFKAIGYVALVPWLFADVGTLGGGWLSGRFIRRGAAPVQARLRVMLGAAMVTMFTFTIYYASETPLIVGLLGVMMLCTMAWMVNLSTIPIDVFPSQLVGTAVGLTTTGAVLGQLTFTYFIGQIVEHYSYGPLFFIMSLLPPTSYVVIRLILRKAPALEPQAKPVLE